MILVRLKFICFRPFFPVLPLVNFHRKMTAETEPTRIGLKLIDILCHSTPSYYKNIIRSTICVLLVGVLGKYVKLLCMWWLLFSLFTTCSKMLKCQYFLNCMLLLSVLTSTLVLGINYFVVITRPLHQIQLLLLVIPSRLVLYDRYASLGNTLKSYRLKRFFHNCQS